MQSIAFVLDRFDPLGGGLERWCNQLCQYLLMAGYEVHVVAFDVREPVDPRLVLHRVPKSSSRLARAEAVEQHLKRLNVDIVHDLGVGWFFDILQPQSGCKLANHLADMQSKSRPERWKTRLSPFHYQWLREVRELEKRQYGSTKGIFIAVSKMVHGDLRHYHDINPGRMRLVYNGVDVEQYSPEHRSTHREQIRKTLRLGPETLFLFAAANFRLKGLRTVLEALRILKENHRDMHVAVVGNGPIEQYQQIAKRLGVAELITFCGFIENSMPYFMASDVLIHPTFYDACSLVVLEALASGLPVITTRVNGAGELIDPGVQGFLLESPNDAGELAMRMRSLLDASLRSTMAKDAYALGVKQSLQNNFRGIEKIYKEIS